MICTRPTMRLERSSQNVLAECADWLPTMYETISLVSASIAVHVHVSPIPGKPFNSAGTFLSF